MSRSRTKTLFNILFTSVGRRVVLIESFQAALDQLGMEGTLVAADTSRTAPGVHIADRSYSVPPIQSTEYIATLLTICRDEAIDLVIPLIDHELPLLAQHHHEFETVGATVLVSDPATIAIAMDKRKTHAFFLGNGFDTPVLYELGGDSVADRMKYPLVIKPAVGSAAIGFTLIADPDSFAFYKDHVQDPLVQEYVEGDEFTLDILVDFEGRVRCVVPRKRLEVRAGEVSKAVTVRNPFIIETGRRVAEALPGAFGPITVQGFLTPDGKFKLIEINPRFGGGHPLAIQAGANFPRWIIEMMIGSADATDYTGWADGLVMLRYDTAVFVEETAIL